jgi:hypothetical protein
MSTLTLKQLIDRKTIALTEHSDIEKIATLFDPNSVPYPYYFAKQSDMKSKISNIPYVMAMIYNDGRIFVDYDNSIEISKDSTTAAKFIYNYFYKQ